jgi:hypothetical protein
MPIKIPTLDDRKYQDLLNEALARIPVHNPQWTNFNKSDPGVTLIEVFSFLTENLLYRANQVPERNRRKFLSLLGIPFQAASPAEGIVTFSNERGTLATTTLNSGLEVRAGQVPFRTGIGLDVLPVEARVYYKHKLTDSATLQSAADYYRQLYQSFLPADRPDLINLELYETIRLPEPQAGSTGIDLNDTSEVVDGLWIALFVRVNDKSSDNSYKTTIGLARKAIAGKTISLGVIPYLPEARRQLAVVSNVAQDAATRLQFEMPAGGKLPSSRIPTYKSLPSEASTNVLTVPGIVQVTLPDDADSLNLWTNLDPLELGVGSFPPSLEDTTLSERLITWIHVTVPSGVTASLYWLGINAAPVSQGAMVTNELLEKGTGEPDQVATLGHAPVIPGSASLRVTCNKTTDTWEEVEDLISAGAEVPVRDTRLSLGVWQPPDVPSEVFQLDAESGQLRFGDGTHGTRPSLDAILRADYTYCVGFAGNVGKDALNAGAALPAGFKVTNPMPTWGGADAETQTEAEKQIPRYLQHRDRLVTVQDFETIAWRTPGVDMGRVEVVPAFHPKLSLAPGDAPGIVTLMVIPLYDSEHPDAPVPDANFLKSVCDYLNPRRLVTTELYVYGPRYLDLWVSIGIQVQPMSSSSGSDYTSIAEVRERVKSAIRQFLSPLPPGANGMPVDDSIPADSPYASGPRGWPLNKAVVSVELAAVAGRVPGVMSVTGVRLLRKDRKGDETKLEMDTLLSLPRLAGISVSVGDPLNSQQLGLGGTKTEEEGGGPETGGEQTISKVRTLPVPATPEECK